MKKKTKELLLVVGVHLFIATALTTVLFLIYYKDDSKGSNRIRKNEIHSNFNPNVRLEYLKGKCCSFVILYHGEVPIDFKHDPECANPSCNHLEN